MQKRFLFLIALVVSCRTSGQKNNSPTIVPNSPTLDSTQNGTESDQPSNQQPGLNPDSKTSPEAKTEELVGSCLRAKSNIPDSWLDCEQFYTGLEKSDYDRGSLHTIQKRQCESNQSIATSPTWFDGECPSSEKHKICPKKTSWVNGIFGKRVLIRYQEAYKQDDCS